MASPDLFASIYQGRRVAVTGHTGFKGSWLCEWLLLLGAEVHGLALDPDTEPSLFDDLGLETRMHHTIADIRDSEAVDGFLETARPEVVFHLAAQPLVRRSYVEPAYTFETNVLGTVNVLEALRKRIGTRVAVNVTSDKVYENAVEGESRAEVDRLGGRDPYSASKACSELVTAAYRASFFSDDGSPRLATARAGNVIGGGDWAEDRLIPDCVRALSTGEGVLIRNPDSTRPWQHVLEPLSGYLHLASRMWAGADFEDAWNFGPMEESHLPVGELVDRFIALWGRGERHCPEQGCEPHEAQFLRLNISKAVGELGWRPVWTVDQALEETARWYLGRLEDPSSARDRTVEAIHSYVEEARAKGEPWV